MLILNGHVLNVIVHCKFKDIFERLPLSVGVRVLTSSLFSKGPMHSVTVPETYICVLFYKIG